MAIDFDKWKKGADVARDVAAVLFVPVVCFLAIGSTLLLVWGPWTPHTEDARLVYVGIGHIVVVMLIALGVFFYQRRDLPKVILHTAAGEFSMDTATATVTPTVSPVTITPAQSSPVSVTVNSNAPPSPSPVTQAAPATDAPPPPEEEFK